MSDPIKTARAEVARHLETELELAARRDALAAGLPVLEASAGSDVLAGGDAAAIASRIAAARVELDVLDRAIETERQRRVDAIGVTFQHEAGALYAAAAAKRSEARARAGKTALLLLQLEAHEGVPYAPVLPDRPAITDPAGLAGGALAIVTRRLPLTEYLDMEADDLERQAEATSSRPVVRHGRAEADDVEALISEATSDPMRIGPTVAAIRAWAAGAEATLAAEIAQAGRRGAPEARAWGAGRPVRLTLYWGDGAIDAASSSAVPVMPEPLLVHTRTGSHYERVTA